MANEQTTQLLDCLKSLIEIKELEIQTKVLEERITEQLINLSGVIRNPHTFNAYMRVLNIPSSIRTNVWRATVSHKLPPEEDYAKAFVK